MAVQLVIFRESDTDLNNGDTASGNNKELLHSEFENRVIKELNIRLDELKEAGFSIQTVTHAVAVVSNDVVHYYTIFYTYQNV